MGEINFTNDLLVYFVCNRMLYDYAERKRKENSGAQLHVTYLVSGSLIQNGHSVSSQNLIVSLNVFESLIVLCNITQGKTARSSIMEILKAT